MSNFAILIGNSEYQNAAELACCRADVVAVEQLLIATGKYATITKIQDADAGDLKERLRSALDAAASPDELFFYFSGHGYMHEREFFLCPTDFDSRRPNQTGLSRAELHTLLRLPDANLVVKVLDACYSGTLMIKSEFNWLMQQAKDFKNIIQFASCTETQESLAGHPLSLFTDQFRAAALSKLDGPVYYTDIVNCLRDEFLENESQTPFFVSQCTGREQFVDDAKKMDTLRKQVNGQNVAVATAHSPDPVAARPLLDRIKAASAKVVTPTLMHTFADRVFDDLKSRLSNDDFGEFYTVEFAEWADFREPTTRDFIIRVLDQEKRPDNFVTAVHARKRRQPNPLYYGALVAASMQRYLDPDAYYEEFDLELNCTMSRAQMKVTLTPRFVVLKRLTLVVTCAPSLDRCYVFEMLTQHLLRDFETYDIEGREISRRWWKFGWNEPPDDVVVRICAKLKSSINAELESAEKRLGSESG
ncbi:caspase domain-containing protein [Pseudorhodoplanes sp.]|uniref:caspase family protein n=1 Tax=Pseudorhodoplanes sp. TaxID=1934341 RepID=UPI00391ADFBE